MTGTQIQHIALRAQDNVALAEFYCQVFGMREVHRTYRSEQLSGIYLADGRVNLALLPSRGGPEGINHFGFKVEGQEQERIHQAVLDFGGSVGDSRNVGHKFAETYVTDLIGTRIDLSVAGWRVQ